jgi:ribosomal protein S18 acetylase RimI-like enzyme
MTVFMGQSLQVSVRRLGPDSLDDFLGFFDKEAFTDFPEWSGCYCLFYETTRDEWEVGPEAAPTNKTEKVDRVREGKATGLLAYADSKVVGWCNAQRRCNFANMRRYSVVVDDATAPVGSIMCFLVAPGYRGRGVCTSLLNSACDMFRAEGLKIAEGYPTTNPSKRAGEIPWAEENYKGPLSVYLNNGFSIHRQLERFAVVRKKL